MADMPEPAPNWRFGAFELVGRTGELRRDGVVVHLQEQPTRLLVYLLKHAGQIVTREDIRARLWPADTFVDFDHSLNTAMMKLREALRDSSEKPLYIQTVPRKGYRFVAPVSLLSSANSSAPAARPAAAEQVSDVPPSGAAQQVADLTESLAPDSTIAAREPHPAAAPPPAATPQRTRQRAIRLSVLAATLIVLAFVGAVKYKQSWDPAPPAHSLTRITFDEGLQSDPTWSPDGRYLAYTAVRDGVTNIWMQQISVGDPIQITSGPGPNWQPDWSPDGRYIAYRSDSGTGGLFVTPALGGAGQERRIASFGYNPRWSPDSSKILFQNGPLAWTEVTQFYVAGLNGGPPRQVLSDFFRQHREFNSISASWHPDGRRITVWIDDPMRSRSAPDFWTIPVDGGPAVYTEIGAPIEQQFRELAAPRGEEWLADSNFAWAPSGDALYFERTFRGARSLWRLNADPRTLRATSAKQLTAGSGLDTDPALSPDGKRLAFTAASGRVSAWLYPFHPERGKIIGAGRAVTSPGIDAWLPNVSQDGSRLVFLGVRAGETYLWLKSLPDGRETPLFVDGYSRNNAQWSRDGTRLAYLRIAHHPEEAQLMTWSSETRQEEPLTSPSSSATDRLQLVYDWSSDDTSLLVTKATPKANTPAVRYEAPGGSIDIAVWRVPVSAAPHAESKEHLIISDPAYDIYQAHQSPDGRWIVFEAVTRKHPQDLTTVGLSSLYVMRASGGPWLPIVVGKNWADKPRWSPDGQTIYFLWSQGSFFDVWGIRFDPETGKTIGDPFRITTLDNPALMVPGRTGSVEMSVTQKDLALTVGQVSGSIWVLDNVDR